MSALNYTFVWKSVNKTMVLPIKLQKSVEENWRGENNLICEDCEVKLNQKYICPKCEKQYTIGQIKKRLDKDTKTVFLSQEYDTFMDNKTVKEIVVEDKPIPFPIDFLELVGGNFLEIFNNEDRYIPVFNRIKETLFVTKTCLLAKVGYYKRTVPALVVGTARKLLLIPLRDKRLVRPTNQVGSVVLMKDEKLEQQLEQFCQDRNIDKYYEFIKIKQEGKVIEVEEKKETEIPANVDMSILDEVMKTNGKKIAVKVR